jgi:hypothetical protein
MAPTGSASTVSSSDAGPIWRPADCATTARVVTLSAPDTKAGRTQRAVLDLLDEHAESEYGLPTTIRFVFYELEQAGLACKPSPDDNRRNRRRSLGWPPGQQDITDAVTYLRDNGHVPWDWFADEERQLYAWAYAGTIAGYVRERLDEAHVSPWGGEPPPLILCESKGTAAALRPLVAEYLCPIAGLKGHTTGFLRTVVARHLDDDDAARRVLYLGDLDKSGADIEAHAAAVLGIDVDNWERIAMTQALADAHGIAPIWKVDGRNGIGHWATEVESLTQARLVDLLRAHLDGLLPEPLPHVREREAEERQVVRELLA